MIPYHDLSKINHPLADDILSEINVVIESNKFVMNTQRFEEEFADYTGAKYCVALSSGTAALHLSLKALGIAEGDEVITVSHTFRATAAAIKYCNAKPVFVDIDKDTFTMDPEKLEDKINTNTKAIIPVHIYGNMADMEKINKISKKHGIPVVEDCSQAHGSTLDNKHAGTLGRIGAYSFYPGKSLGAFGDAGAVVTDDEALAKDIAGLRNWSDDDVGHNYRMASIQAEALRIKLQNYSDVLAAKEDIAEYYQENLQKVFIRRNVRHSWHIYPYILDEKYDREDFIEKLSEKVELKIHYPVPVHRLNAYKSSYDLPNTDFVANHQVSIPIYPEVEKEEVVESINNYFATLL